MMQMKKPCNSCPWAFTEESEIVQNYGCLPTPYDTIEVLKQHGAVWGCHYTSDSDGNLQPCNGLLLHLSNQFEREMRPDLPVIKGDEEVVDYSQWSTNDDYYNRFKLTINHDKVQQG